MLIKSMMETDGTNKKTYRKLADNMSKYELIAAILGVVVISLIGIKSAYYGILNAKQMIIWAVYLVVAIKIIKREITYVEIESLEVHGKKYIKITETKHNNVSYTFCVSSQKALPVGRKGKTVYLAANTPEFVGNEIGEYEVTFNLSIVAKKFLKDLKRRYYEQELAKG